jgi:hypothetical protein
MTSLAATTGEFYRSLLERLSEVGPPYLVGGAYGLEHYTGIARHTKDVDVFVRRSDRDRVLDVLAAAGYRTEVTSPIWLAKARYGEDFADIIFSSGNGIAEVDDEWFAHARHGTVLGVRVPICPPEEMIWSKGYVMERDRYDGADIHHLVRGCGRELDWRRLLARFGAHWRVLLSHLVLFGFVYPDERGTVPAWVMKELTERMHGESGGSEPGERVCLGTLLSKHQYRVDLDRWGYRDGRLPPSGRMTRADAERIDSEG